MCHSSLVRLSALASLETDLTWKLLKWSREATKSAAGAKGIRAIASESCVAVDCNTLVVLGSAHAMLVRLSFSAVRVAARCDTLPVWWKGSSPGIQGIPWGRADEREVIFWNLYPKTVSNALAVHIDAHVVTVGALLPATTATAMAPLIDANAALCHRPPLAPVPLASLASDYSTGSGAPVIDGVYLSDDGCRWVVWNGETRSFFALPVAASAVPLASKTSGFSTQGEDDEVALMSYASVKEDDDEDGGASASGMDDDDANDGAEEMPLLVEVHEQRVRTTLKQYVAPFCPVAPRVENLWRPGI